MRILITGGAGFIGSAVIRHLIADTIHTIVNVDCLTYAGNLSTLSEVDTHPRPFVPAPINDAEGAAMFRAVRNLLAKWEVTDEQASVLLDVPVRTFRRWTGTTPGQWRRASQPAIDFDRANAA